MAIRDPRRRLGGAITAPALVAVLAGAGSIGISIVRDKQYHPDTRHYAFRTLTLLGRGDAAARAEAGSFLRAHGVRAPMDVVERPQAGLFKPRVLYPALSVPFVAAIGLAGLLVVPFAASVVFALLLWVAFARRAPPWIATGAVALVVLSRTFVAYGAAALTESLSLALLVAAWLAFPDEERPGVPLAAFAATLAAGLAREVTAYLLLAALAGVLSSRRRDAGVRRAWNRTAAAVAAATALGLVWTSVGGGVGPFFQLERFTHERGIVDAIGALPPVFGRALAGTAAALVRDPALLVLVALAVVGAARRPRTLDAAFAGGALVATLGLLVLNAISTKFRVQLPLVPFVARLAAVEVAAVISKRRTIGAGRTRPGPGGPSAAAL